MTMFEHATPADHAACREMIRGGSKSFHAASLMLPDAMRSAAYALYGFCRLSDDMIDLEERRAGALDRLNARLDAMYRGAPMDAPVDRALADVVAAYHLPRALLDALLEGLSWDVEGRAYETLSDLYAYAARVAGAVGAMMAVLMEARTPVLIARASELGLAMQLTNIARDVGEDAALGRLYLPRAWMREAGLDPDAWLARPIFDARLAGVVARLLDTADALYARADIGIGALAAPYRPGIWAARLLYADIGAQVARNRYDSMSVRARVSTPRKLALAAQAMRRAHAPPTPHRMLAPVPEIIFLCEAVAAAPVPRPLREAPRGLDADAAWVVDLFASLETRPRRVA